MPPPGTCGNLQTIAIEGYGDVLLASSGEIFYNTPDSPPHEENVKPH